MRARWGVVLAFAAITVTPITAATEESKGAPAHIAATQAFLLAWGHEQWDDLRGVAAEAVPVKLGEQVFTIEPASRKAAVMLQFPFRGLAPEAFSPIFDRLLAKDPALRCPSALAAIELLEGGVVTTEPSSETAEATRIEPSGPKVEPFAATETPRLRLRCVRPEDAPAIARMMTAPVSRRLASWPVPYTMEMAAQRIEEARSAAWNHRLLPLVLERRSDGMLLGWISVAPASPAEPRLGMLTYWLGEAFHGQGLMREAAPPAIATAFREFGLEAIRTGSTTVVENVGGTINTASALAGTGLRWVFAESATDRVGGSPMSPEQLARSGPPEFSPKMREEGLKRIADLHAAWHGKNQGRISVFPAAGLAEKSIDIVIVAVPASAAQEVVDRVVRAGVRGILNFAPVQLRVPAGVALKNVNMAVEMEGLSFALARR